MMSIPRYKICPQSILCVPDLSGQLEPHECVCPYCNGSRHMNADPYPPVDGQCAHCNEPNFPECCELCDPCSFCSGEGVIQFGDWYGETRGTCYSCDEENVLLTTTGSTDGGTIHVCLPCWLKEHKELCGCDRWEWAERLIFGPGEFTK